jgi:hypothetical protein
VSLGFSSDYTATTKVDAENQTKQIKVVILADNFPA